MLLTINPFAEYHRGAINNDFPVIGRTALVFLG